MGATSDNYQIVTSGTTYTIASDYVNPTGGETAHIQLVKIIHGADGATAYATSTTPLPVGVCGAWARYDYLSTSGYYGLAVNIVGFTGTDSLAIVGTSGGEAVGITVGTLVVSATDLDTRTLYGGTVGYTLGITGGIDYVAVQGICGGYPVGITVDGSLPVSLSVSSNIGIFGVSGATAVGVTFGTVNIRGITAASDTITVYGGGTASTVSVGLFGFTGATAAPLYAENNALNVNVKTFAVGISGVTVSASDLDIRDIDYTTDTITVVGEGASDDASLSTVPTYITGLDTNGNLIQIGGITGAGWCAGALNVYLVNDGITFAVNATATFSAEIGITAPAAGAIPVQGSTYAAYPVWIAGNTSGDPVSVQGTCGGYLLVDVKNFDTNIATVNTTATNIKNNTDFMAAVKKALYSDAQSVGAFDFSDKFSIYTLVRDSIGVNIEALKNAIVLNGSLYSSQDSMAVTVVAQKQQPSFMARTASATNSSQNLTAFNSGSGYTCANGVRIKTSRIATGANASQNEVMCVISEADAALYGASAGTASYVLYHGDEMFFEVDNINKIKVFYPAYSASFAPHNTGAGMTFSFYAS
jgi:hypothetical protein